MEVLMKKCEIEFPAYSLRTTPLGPVAILWSIDQNEPFIGCILLSKPGFTAGDAARAFSPESVASSCPEINSVLDQMEAFLSGEDACFSLERLRLELCSAFQRSVLRADYAIPRGRVSTYRGIAEHMENPKGARAVGTALAKNPFPIMIPCHRAIRSDGALGGFQYGLEMKRKLLEMEGVVFRDAEHVATRDFFVDFETEKILKKSVKR